MMANKEAIVFILDASPSMNAPYPARPYDPAAGTPPAQGGGYDSDDSDATTDEHAEDDGGTRDNDGGGGSTRLSSAKAAMEGMLCDLMLRSKTHEAGVVILKTAETRHHMAAEEQVEDGTAPFPNLTELSEVTRPTVDLLRKVRSVRSAKYENGGGKSLRGDFVDGIIVAADALHRRTFGKRYRRQLVLFTDAAHEVTIDPEQTLMVLEGLRKMDCTLKVIGLDFEHSGVFEPPTEEEEAEEDEGGSGDGEDRDMDAEEDDGDGDDDGMGESTDGGEPDDDHWAHVKSENEKLLISLAQQTGGTVVAASTMQQILDSTSGRRIPKSSKRNVELLIAPGLSVNAKFALLLSKASLPSLKREVCVLDENGDVKRNGLGEEMTLGVRNFATHSDADNPDVGVEIADRTKAFKYGADLIPVGGFDLEGLKMRSPTQMSILGYVGMGELPRYLLIGPPYAVAGGASRRACTAISALAQALHLLKMAAVCRFVKGKDADPIIGVLLPLLHGGDHGEKKPQNLFFIQLPFANDVQDLIMSPLDDNVRNEAEDKACDDLIDALMLPDGTLRSETVPNPAIRCFHKTVMRRAIEPSASIVSPRGGDGAIDAMSTPPDILAKATRSVEAFRIAFPLERPLANEGKNKKARKKQWIDAD